MQQAVAASDLASQHDEVKQLHDALQHEHEQLQAESLSDKELQGEMAQVKSASNDSRSEELAKAAAEVLRLKGAVTATGSKYEQLYTKQLQSTHEEAVHQDQQLGDSDS